MEKVDDMQDNTRSLPDTVQVEPRLPFGKDFQAILSLIGDAVVCTDEDGQIILFNRAAEVLFGYTSMEMIGAPIEALVPTRLRISIERITASSVLLPCRHAGRWARDAKSWGSARTVRN